MFFKNLIYSASFVFDLLAIKFGCRHSMTDLLIICKHAVIGILTLENIHQRRYVFEEQSL